jgi:hypothetical protein
MSVSDRPTPISTARFDLPLRAVRSALDAIDALGPSATPDDLFRVASRFSAAAGFLARELHHANEASRFRQDLPARSTDAVEILRPEFEPTTTTFVNPAPPIAASTETSAPVSAPSANAPPPMQAPPAESV